MLKRKRYNREVEILKFAMIPITVKYVSTFNSNGLTLKGYLYKIF